MREYGSIRDTIQIISSASLTYLSPAIAAKGCTTGLRDYIQYTSIYYLSLHMVCVCFLCSLVQQW